MSEFKKKRESLETFLTEQIIGPGSFNKRFFLLNKWENGDFNGKLLKKVKAIENRTEVITEVPAYQYSSAILFPETKMPNNTIAINTPKDVENDDTSNEEENSIETLDDENANDDKSESLSSKQQNYPNSCGLSFAVAVNADLENDLYITVSFRQYSRLSKKLAKENKLGYWIPEHEKEISNAISNYFKDVFGIETIDKNLFVYLKPEVNLTKQLLYEIDYVLLNKYLLEVILPVIETSFENCNLLETKKYTDKKTKKEVTVKYFGIPIQYGGQFYTITDKISYSNIEFNDVIKIFDNGLSSYIKNQFLEDSSRYTANKNLIDTIEIFKQLTNLITTLKSIYNEGKAIPVWESSYKELSIKLEKYNGKDDVVRSANVKIDGVENLNYLYQYFKHKESKKLYIKLLLINKANIKIKEGEPTSLNKKDEANEKAFFGVKLTVNENKVDILQQYNPPHLLDFDFEDNFNKLIYRTFEDYGEGYNTSVNWGSISNSKFKFVATEFLPELESPKVDFVPSKVVNGKIISRITNERVLSMRYLSTLSDISDDDILSTLGIFINQYNIWIKEKRIELGADSNIVKDSSEEELLISQLKACEKDYLRLKRNITLLQKNKKAIAAFRLMNTAMFMQLHHSINIKKSKIFVPETNNESFYKHIPFERDENNIEKDYKWRSFQLAFILLNIDGFVKPEIGDETVKDVFETGWPERNEIADLVWFPTGGGKTEAYLGIIAFATLYRRFTNGELGNGTSVLMRYTLRLLTLQQFQRATLLICALEAIRKDGYPIPHSCRLGSQRITIGLFVGSGSLPNKWAGEDKSMVAELRKILSNVSDSKNIKTNIPFTNCPWCGSELFINNNLSNLHPNLENGANYGINDQFNVACNNNNCTYHLDEDAEIPTDEASLPFRLFDEDIYKFPPTLLFGTVDKFAALANNITSVTGERNKDSRRFFGKGHKQNTLPPELIIQDELHLLLGPLGSAVGLFEKAIDQLCCYEMSGLKIRPKIITSTATTRNTDKQIFALFNRRSEIFPKQGILCDDSFFAYYERNEASVKEYNSNRKYVGILPVGKTQVWMQLRVAAITLTHRLKYLKEHFDNDQVFAVPTALDSLKEVFDYSHTILSYFNSLKEVGKTQSQLSHYLPGDVNLVINNTTPWSFLDILIRKEDAIDDSELTGRLSGEEVKTNLSAIERKWNLFTTNDGLTKLNENNPPEFIISTNMISVGIDVSRFNTMIINSMPRNVAEYIQASSRVARDKEGIVFTVHHPFRSRDISHYQKFKEFHEKFYSYVEPISVTPFANKALDRYFAMFLAVMVRHTGKLELMDNKNAVNINVDKVNQIKKLIMDEIRLIKSSADKLEFYLNKRTVGIKSSIDGIISDEEVSDIEEKLDQLLVERWLNRLTGQEPKIDLEYRDELKNRSLFISNSDDNYPSHWKVGYSLREIAPSIVIKTVQQ